MLFHSTRNQQEKVSLEQAVLQGLAPDGGLYVPEHIPRELNDEYFERLSLLNYPDLCSELAAMWFSEDIPKTDLKRMVEEAYSDFSPEIKPLEENIFGLELFHGPTMSFKDFGARMLAQLMNHFAERKNQKLTILVATSGDTGVAIASAFSGLKNIRVVILYPKGKVSPFQENQMLAAPDNVYVYAVEGTFDDCQKNVKIAFLDPELKGINLTSANSINIGRLIPQAWYYVYGYSKIESKSGSHIPAVFSVPSGNFGNLTACLMASLMGVPTSRIIAATNINDSIPYFLKTGVFQVRPSLQTLANSMDIGNPSNWERIQYYLGKDYQKVGIALWGTRKTDDEIRNTMKKYLDQGYLIDPHSAIGLSALEEYEKAFPGKYVGISVMTGSPYKYQELLESIHGEPFNAWPDLGVVRKRDPKRIDRSFERLERELLSLN